MVRMGNLSIEGLEGFERFGLPHPGTGVYVLMYKGTVLYVGKSLNIFHRIGQHVTAMRRHMKGGLRYKSKEEVPFIEFDEIKVKWVPIARIDVEELKLIQRFLPEHNVKMNRVNIDVSDIPGVAKLIANAIPARSLQHGNTMGAQTHIRRRAA
jgi:hypothetical protein